jgi:hypothetical protein
MYNNLVESCFDRCVMVGWGGVSSWILKYFFASITWLLVSQNFQSKTLDEKEVKCVTLCAEKYLKATQRMGFRFAEHQTNKAQQLQDQAKK